MSTILVRSYIDRLQHLEEDWEGIKAAIRHLPTEIDTGYVYYYGKGEDGEYKSKPIAIPLRVLYTVLAQERDRIAGDVKTTRRVVSEMAELASADYETRKERDDGTQSKLYTE